MSITISEAVQVKPARLCAGDLEPGKLYVAYYGADCKVQGHVLVVSYNNNTVAITMGGVSAPTVVCNTGWRYELAPETVRAVIQN